MRGRSVSVVLSLGKLGPGQQEYYVDAVARGAEEYYTNAGEAPGLWVGAGAELLGLSGEVDGEDLARVLGNEHPREGWRLTGSRSVPTVAGFDATFCAPKSVSLLHAFGSPEVSNEVRNAADAAVAAALPVLEREACRVRRGKGGRTVLDAEGFVAAAFRHRTSRAADPHLHTHVVIANVARGIDGRWSALDGRPVYSWLSAVGHLYDAHLRWELTRRLGVVWEPVRRGVADIDGIGHRVRREFSTRRKEIEAHLEERGQVSARAAQYAAYATRKAKDPSLDTRDLQAWWWRRARSVGLDPKALAAVLDRSAPAEPPHRHSPDADLYRWLAGPDGLTRQASTFGRREVIKAVCDALPAGGRVEAILDLVDGFLASPHVLALGVQRDGATIRRDDGTVIAARTDDERFTTPEMLRVEARLLDSAVRRRATAVAVVDDRRLGRVVAEHASLTGEQAAMVRSVCSSGDGVEVVHGIAGAGKTFALAAARQAWEDTGYQVIGCSLAARAARRLETGAGIPSCTLDRLLRRGGVDARTVVVVDEAAMVGTRKLARLLEAAETAGAKVVLVGDPFQLPEIGAGGAFRGLEARLGSSRLTDNRRQADAWERDALAELRHGEPGSAVDAYLAHDRVHHLDTAGDARAAMVEEWMNARAEGEDVLMVAARMVDVDDLNHRARRTLQLEGHIGEDRVVLGGRPFAVGDEVLALRNDYDIGVLNGTRATIERIDRRRRVIEVDGDDGQRLAIPFRYAAAGHLAHGYATTVHKAQGATVDRCLVVADDAISRELAYTAMSRGRHGNDLYLVADDRRVDERHAVEVQPGPLDALRAAVIRRRDKHLAIDERRVDVAALRRERDELRDRLDDAAPPDVGFEVRRLAEDRDQARAMLDDARRRYELAQQDLDDLGPVRRRVPSSRRREIEDRLERFTTEIARHEADVANLDRQLLEYAPALRARRSWEHENADDRTRLTAIERTIDLTERLDQVVVRSLDRGVQASRGIELGL